MNFPLFPDQASTIAKPIDDIAIAITVLSIFFTLVVFAAVLFLAIRYRRGSSANRKNASHHNLWLELAWSLPPLFLGLFIFAWSVIPFAQVYNPPKNAEEIFVIGKRWMWHLQHANGIRENNELHVPVGRPFKLTIISQDVIHGFYVPDFRVKRDAIPGLYNTVWFEATKPGKHHLFCTEYCGTNHSQMGGWVYVMNPADYDKWVASGGTRMETSIRTPQEDGAELFSQLACGNCHKTEDSARAPSLAGLLGRQRVLQSGKTITADENYIRNAIVKPEDNLLAGWGPTMQSYKEQLTEQQIHDLIAYIKSLGGQAGNNKP
jgi:cytochrome c oxidase subunit 2